MGCKDGLLPCNFICITWLYGFHDTNTSTFIYNEF
ncbi:teichoic acid D-Ala incorporation-associated protein DltX [Bacillus pacificus]